MSTVLKSLALSLAFAASAAAQNATLRTAAGDNHTGTAALGPGDAVTVTADDGSATTVPLSEITSLKLPRTTAGDDTPVISRFNSLPAPWRSRDVGRLKARGNTTWKDGTFTLNVAPRAETEDFSAFHFVYRPVLGSCTIVARVVSIENPDEDSHAGLMIADGLTPRDNRAFLSLHYGTGEGAKLRSWGYRGGSTRSNERPDITPPYWLRLTKANRKGVSAHISKDGKSWELISEMRGGPRNDTCFIGIAAAVAKFDHTSPVVIDNVSFPYGTFPDTPPYPRTTFTSGTELIADLVSLDQNHLTFAGTWQALRPERATVSRVEFVFPLGDEATALIDGRRPGVLLRSGDFATGTLSPLEGRTLTVTSPLLGPLDVDIANDVDAVALAPVRKAHHPAKFVVLTQDTSTLFATSITAHPDKPDTVIVHEPVLGQIDIPFADLAIVRTNVEEEPAAPQRRYQPPRNR